MDTLFLILLPLVISSLGFLSYRHPKIARQILKPLLYITVASFSLLQVYYFVQSSAFYKAIEATRIVDYKYQDKVVNVDSLYKNVKDKDSINFIISENRYEREKSLAIYKNQNAVRDSIKSNIDVLLGNSRETNNNYLLYCFAAFLIALTLYGLTFLFNNIHDNETVSDLSNSNEQS